MRNARAFGPLESAVRGEPWYMAGPSLRRLAARARQLDATWEAPALARALDPMEEDYVEYQVEAGVALIPIQGTMYKQVPTGYMGSKCEGVSTLAVGDAVDRALADPAVSRLLLVIDSPGGHVDGTDELAETVWQARAVKPIHAVISGNGCSAAYYVACQCETVSADRSAAVGSIGTIMVWQDATRLYREEGLTVQPITTSRDHPDGDLKGAGVDGTALSDVQRAYVEELIDGWGRAFYQAVARGRGLDERQVYDRYGSGRFWIAPDALALGLIDFVESAAQVWARVSGRAPPVGAHAVGTQPVEGKSMSILDRILGRAPKATATPTAEPPAAEPTAPGTPVPAAAEPAPEPPKPEPTPEPAADSGAAPAATQPDDSAPPAGDTPPADDGAAGTGADPAADDDDGTTTADPETDGDADDDDDVPAGDAGASAPPAPAVPATAAATAAAQLQAELQARTELFGGDDAAGRFAMQTLADGQSREQALTAFLAFQRQALEQARTDAQAAATALTERERQHKAALEAAGLVGESTAPAFDAGDDAGAKGLGGEAAIQAAAAKINEQLRRRRGETK